MPERLERRRLGGREPRERREEVEGPRYDAVRGSALDRLEGRREVRERRDRRRVDAHPGATRTRRPREVTQQARSERRGPARSRPEHDEELERRAGDERALGVDRRRGLAAPERPAQSRSGERVTGGLRETGKEGGERLAAAPFDGGDRGGGEGTLPRRHGTSSSSSVRWSVSRFLPPSER